MRKIHKYKRLITRHVTTQTTAVWPTNSLFGVLFLKEYHPWRYLIYCLYQWPRGLRRGSETSRLLGLWFRIPLGGIRFSLLWICVLWRRGLCYWPFPRQMESYRLWCVFWVIVKSRIWGRSGPLGALAPCKEKNKLLYLILILTVCEFSYSGTQVYTVLHQTL